MANAQLNFRRHLAFCVFLLLVYKLSDEAHLNRSWWSSVARESFRSAAAIQQQQTAYDGRPIQEEAWRQTGSAVNDDNDDQYQFNPLDYLLNLIDPYLPTLNFNYSIIADKQFVNSQLDIDVENYYEERFGPNMTLDQLQLASVKAAFRLAPIPLHTSWGYELRDDLRKSSLPVQDDLRCASHLSQLSSRLDKITGQAQGSTSDILVTNKMGEQALESPIRAASIESSPVENYEAQLLYKSQDVQFMRYLDTFGRAPSDFLRGNVKWYGSYSGCLDTKLEANPKLGGQTKHMKFRYCMVALKSVAWHSSPAASNSKNGAIGSSSPKWIDYGVHTRDANSGNFFIRVGVCLPQACDSSAIDYQENLRNIEKLTKFNLMKPFNSDHYYINDLYCLPDQRSPLKSIPLMGKLLILISLAWMGLIVLATTVHLNVERFYTKAVKEIRRKQKLEDVAQVVVVDNNENGNDSLSSSSTKTRNSIEKERDNNNEFKEIDILHLKQHWIKMNVYIWDKSKQLIGGVDLIACLSLYSNWLKYTNRLKLAVAQLHADQQRRERIRVRNQHLVESVRGAPTSGAGKDKTSGAHRKRLGNNNSTIKVLHCGQGEGESVNDGGQCQRLHIEPLPVERKRDEEWKRRDEFDKELGRRLEALDDSDELDCDSLKKRVDTSSLNALKVIALIWIIAGHCVFFLGSNVSNGAIFKKYSRDLPAYALANGAMYITELFFVITGCLTAYLAFKYNTFELRQKGEEGAEQRAERDCLKQKDAGEEEENKGSEQNRKQQQERKKDASLELKQHHKQRQQQQLEVEPQQPQAYMESRMFKIPFWIMVVVNRYLRILPTYLLVYCFVRLVSVYVGGYGQVWDYAVSANSMRRKCIQESWLPVLTLTTNFVDIYGHCIVGGWYLSADMQFMLMAIPMLLIMAHCQRRKWQRPQHFVAFSKQQEQPQQLTFIGGGQAGIGGGEQAEMMREPPNGIVVSRKSILASYSLVFLAGLSSAILSMVYGILQSEVDLSYIMKFVPHTVAILSKNIAMYTNSLFRFRAFALGLILGHLLYLYEFRLIKLPKFVQQHGAKLTTIIFSIGFCIMFLPVLYPKGKIILSHEVTVILMILSAGGIDIFISILIFLTCIGKAPKVVLFFLNSPFWSVLSSLSLCAFLLHTEIIVLLTSQLDPPPTCTYSILIFVFSATLILTYLLALGLYLSFEMPVSRLTEALIRKYSSRTAIIRSDKSTKAIDNNSN